MARCFNPTLVRLRRGCRRSGGWWRSSFQSHAGSIEARSTPTAPTPKPPWFQSHAGSIEAWFARVGVLRGKGFNPTLVRLRPPYGAEVRRGVYAFQSHAGSIEAPGAAACPPEWLLFQSHAGSIEAWACCPAGRTPPRFNPTLVRLRHRICAAAPSPHLVSIPRWFD